MAPISIVWSTHCQNMVNSRFYSKNRCHGPNLFREMGTAPISGEHPMSVGISIYIYIYIYICICMHSQIWFHKVAMNKKGLFHLEWFKTLEEFVATESQWNYRSKVSWSHTMSSCLWNFKLSRMAALFAKMLNWETRWFSFFCYQHNLFISIFSLLDWNWCEFYSISNYIQFNP